MQYVVNGNKRVDMLSFYNALAYMINNKANNVRYCKMSEILEILKSFTDVEEIREI